MLRHPDRVVANEESGNFFDLKLTMAGNTSRTPIASGSLSCSEVKPGL